jgi:hypothetical protein
MRWGTDPEPGLAAAHGSSRRKAVAAWASEVVAAAPLFAGPPIGAAPVWLGTPGKCNAPPAAVVGGEGQRATTSHAPHDLDVAWARDQRRQDESPQLRSGAVAEDLWAAASGGLADGRRPHARSDGASHRRARGGGLRALPARAAAGQGHREEGGHQRHTRRHANRAVVEAATHPPSIAHRNGRPHTAMHTNGVLAPTVERGV